ncbi:MAG: PadR family transcriptional regulator, partial [Lacisediminihabitans sp.]
MKTLRADLASAAREARADARGAGRSGQADPQHHASTSHLRDAEMALDEFRHNMRADLRGWAVHTEVSAEIVTTLKSELDALRKSLFR